MFLNSHKGLQVTASAPIADVHFFDELVHSRLFSCFPFFNVITIFVLDNQDYNDSYDNKKYKNPHLKPAPFKFLLI